MTRKIVYVDQDLFDYLSLGDTLFIANHLPLEGRLNAIANVIAAEV